MSRLMHLAGVAALVAAAACSEPTAPARAPVGAPLATISDASHGGGPSHFYFLPPVVKQPASFGGTFDAALSPTVVVCQLSGPTCGATVATFTTAGSGPSTVKLDAAGEKYKVNFQTQLYSLSPSQTYRISVYSGSVLLGYSDLKVVSSGGDVKSVDQNAYAVVKNGSNLSIAFRIEQGIPGAVVVSPALDTIPVGQTAQFTASVTDLHGNPLAPVAVSWSSSDPAVATVDVNGLASGVSIGTATITATAGSVSGSATLVVKTPNHPPVAANDTFQAIGNVTVPVQAPGVLAGDTDPDADPLSAVAGTFPTAQGGSITINADGSFSYLSAPGFTGTDSAPYVVTDGIDADTGQVVLTVASRVWYVKNTASAPGDGRDASPFATLAQAEAASTPGETILVLFGDVSITGMDAGITLKAGQSLIGQGISSPVVATVNGGPLVLLASGSAPTVGRSSAGTTVQLATNNTVRGLGIASSAGDAVAGSSFGTLTMSEVAVGATGGAGVNLQDGTAAVTLSNLSSSGSADAGLKLVNVAGSFSAVAGSISGSAVAGVYLNGGAANVGYGGSVSTSAGRSVWVEGRTGGSVDLSGDITDTGTGLLVHGSTGGSVAFTGGSKVLSTGANTAVNVGSNPGATVRFAGGGLNVTTTSGVAFTATGGGTVIVTGAHNKLLAQGGRALFVSSTTIGSGGLTFESISADGGPNGIFLSSTGATSGLLVTGDGSAGSGGTIRNQTGADGSAAGVGIYLSDTRAPELHSMQLNDFSNFAIRGLNLAGFTLASSRIDGGSGDNASLHEGGLSFSNLSGSAAITGSTIGGGFTDNVRLVNTAGTLDRLTLVGDTFALNATATGEDGVHLEAQSAAVLKVTVQNSVFTGSRTDQFDLSLSNSASADLVFSGNAVRNAHPAVVSGAGGLLVTGGGTGSTASLTYQITGNTIRDALGSAVVVQKGAGTGAFSGTVANNQIGSASAANSGSAQGSGIEIAALGGGTHTVLLSGNVIRQYNNFGISLSAGNAALGGSGTLNATVRSNDIANPGTSAFPMNGVMLNAGTNTGDAHQVCLDLGGAGSLANAITGSGAFGGTDFRLRQRFLTTVKLPGYAGTSSNNAAVVTFEQGRNGGAPTGSAANTVSTGGGGFVGAASCPQP
jgi:hypothetical protein